MRLRIEGLVAIEQLKIYYKQKGVFSTVKCTSKLVRLTFQTEGVCISWKVFCIFHLGDKAGDKEAEKK